MAYAAATLRGANAPTRRVASPPWRQTPGSAFGGAQGPRPVQLGSASRAAALPVAAASAASNVAAWPLLAVLEAPPLSSQQPGDALPPAVGLQQRLQQLQELQEQQRQQREQSEEQLRRQEEEEVAREEQQMQAKAQAQQGAGATPAFCDQEPLTGLMRQFVERQDGFDTGLQMDGLLAYYRRLGCSPQQIQAATIQVVPATPEGGAAAALNTRALAQQLQLAAWELVAAALAAAALAAFQSRPRGWSRKDILEVRSSAIAGRGLFATAPIPAGTVLGSYPGRLRSQGDMVDKFQTAPLAASYAFRTANGSFLDPTDVTGEPSPYPQPGWYWPVPIDVSLCYANEPPKGSPGTNATVEDGNSSGELQFVACRDIMQGAEVLIDYGLTYDRSRYGK